MVLIEYDFTEGEEVHHRVIDGCDYRIIYANETYCLQYKNKDMSKYNDYIISPHNHKREDNDGGKVDLSQGYLDLMGVLGCIEDSVKLQNGEYWSLELSLYQNGKIVDEFEEIITREDGESLIKKLETCGEVIKEANLYTVEDDGLYDLYGLFIKGCVIIFIMAIILVMIKILNIGI